MSNIIDFPGQGGGKGPGHIITQSPMRLRWGPWRTSHIIQVHVGAAAAYEDFREECSQSGQDPAAQMPAHFTLNGGLRDTAIALLRFRNNNAAQENVTYLSLLMEILVNVPCPILRTDLIRRVYKEVDRLSSELILRWRSQDGHFMLPLATDAAEPYALAQAIAHIENLSEFFDTIKSLAHKHYQELRNNYVFYFPQHSKL